MLISPTLSSLMKLKLLFFKCKSNHLFAVSPSMAFILRNERVKRNMLNSVKDTCDFVLVIHYTTMSSYRTDSSVN